MRSGKIPLVSNNMATGFQALFNPTPLGFYNTANGANAMLSSITTCCKYNGFKRATGERAACQ